jgi:DNA-binding CsgD family transcriptional regulator
LADVIRSASAAPLRDDPRHLLHLGMAAGFLGDVRQAVVAGAPLLAKARERGAIGVLVPALALIATAHAWLGDHNAAFAAAGEAVELGERLGYVADVATAVAMLAWQSASRGLHDDARQSLDKARALMDRAGTTAVGAHQAITAAYCALCRGDVDEVAAVLEARIAADGGVGALGEPLGVAPLLVEAFVAQGRIGDATDLAARYATATPGNAPPRVKALVARCQAVVTPDDGDPAAVYAAAIEQHTRSGDPFEEARTRLLYGAWLRRSGQRIASREQLRAAAAGFETMGLTLWAQRAAHELAATGATARRRTTSESEPLTSQETRVALLVAEGMSNREVATALFLSPKTVEHHLASIYRKRGFRGRVDLVRAYASTASNRTFHEGPADDRV